MAEREKVIRNLQSVANVCALNGDIQSMRTIDDALDLLKEQEARMMTEADFENNPKVDENGNLPCWIEYRPLVGIAVPVDGWSRINKEWVEGYRDRRFWTSRPTKEQRKNTPWESPKEEEDDSR